MRNMGRIDQIVRFTVSAVLLGLVMFGVIIDFTAGLLTGLALFLVVTATARICPIFSLLGVTSFSLDKYMPYLIDVQSRAKSLWNRWVGRRLTNR